MEIRLERRPLAPGFEQFVRHFGELRLRFEHIGLGPFAYRITAFGNAQKLFEDLPAFLNQCGRFEREP